VRAAADVAFVTVCLGGRPGTLRAAFAIGKSLRLHPKV